MLWQELERDYSAQTLSQRTMLAQFDSIKAEKSVVTPLLLLSAVK